MTIIRQEPHARHRNLHYDVYHDSTQEFETFKKEIHFFLETL